jgi:hypothetical protein
VPAIKNLYPEKAECSDLLIVLGSCREGSPATRHSPVESLLYCRIPMKKLALHIWILNPKESKVFIMIVSKYSKFNSSARERIFWARYL